MKTALITGITGQDGSYLTEFLLAQGYTVHGIIRRSSVFNTNRIDHVYKDPNVVNGEAQLFLHYGDLSDPGLLTELIYNIRPDEVYHLGAQSHVRVSFDMPEYTGNITALGTTRLLEAIRRSGIRPRFYQASSSEMFGAAPPPQNEHTPFAPQSPYAIAKLYAYWMTCNYRDAYGLFACNGILFNHESPRRGETFLTRKVTRALAFMLSGKQRTVYLGNLDARRDWGYAPEYVQMMWLMLQQDRPDDYVVGTGETHSVREFVEEAFSYVGIELEWRGERCNQQGIVASVAERWDHVLRPGDVVVQVLPKYFRPTEVDVLQADITKARQQLGWEPQVHYRDLVRIMVDYDLLFEGIEPPGEGIAIEQQLGYTWIQQPPYNVTGGLDSYQRLPIKTERRLVQTVAELLAHVEQEEHDL
ncbi:MAG: GDP-mannose 4,6-dehydratase [Bacteroidota bacterium]|nr:GDP-mannose 4,6-dehydratase [Candidatus Kapabacteria bacterium]MCS7303059.1 GDP-mannose 4,6-dehydratase [Candidatus Kapabacteria bacterium]MCX7937622.1 GDP-mannose 4,6-dehydratase [Chlorobiota bacterium]MDW8075202.1 GDP-mannose 4,6-dehydratase [Bacteroidota bacterium]MDW8272434.1 GDP-mannose 4,6-dehydratase [Bacteroidota bacterium]